MLLGCDGGGMISKRIESYSVVKTIVGLNVSLDLDKN